MSSPEEEGRPPPAGVLNSANARVARDGATTTVAFGAGPPHASLAGHVRNEGGGGTKRGGGSASGSGSGRGDVGDVFGFPPPQPRPQPQTQSQSQPEPQPQPQAVSGHHPPPSMAMFAPLLPSQSAPPQPQPQSSSSSHHPSLQPSRSTLASQPSPSPSPSPSSREPIAMPSNPGVMFPSASAFAPEWSSAGVGGSGGTTRGDEPGSLSGGAAPPSSIPFQSSPASASSSSSSSSYGRSRPAGGSIAPLVGPGRPLSIQEAAAASAGTTPTATGEAQGGSQRRLRARDDGKPNFSAAAAPFTPGGHVPSPRLATTAPAYAPNSIQAAAAAAAATAVAGPAELPSKPSPRNARPLQARPTAPLLPGASNPRPTPELLKAIHDRHSFYMFKFRTTFCPLFSMYKCDQAKPYTCRFAHYENHVRREPKLKSNGRWSYSASLCPHASLLECPNANECPNSHRMQKEHVFHPSTYKTQNCEAPSNGDYDECPIYGPHCSKAHGPLDLRPAEATSDDEPLSDSTEDAETPPTINVTLSQIGGISPRPIGSSVQMEPPGSSAERRKSLTASAAPWNPDAPQTSSKLATSVHPVLSPSPQPQIALREVDPVLRGIDVERAIRDLESIPAPALTPPLPTIPEQLEHEKYMFSFRVAICHSAPCPNDSYTCFNAHSDTPRRRKPQLVHGRYNYIPTRCRYVLEDKECPQGIHCRFAHCTEEVIYHPSKYKTQICSHQLDQRGHCSGYGMHCAKAHGEEDRRIPVFECMEEGINANVTANDFYQFVCPVRERAAERHFYMFLYKTRKCPGFPWDCQCNGFDYHRPEERRRGPLIKYSPVACPNVKSYLNAEWGDPNTDACPKSVKTIKRALSDGREETESEEEWECPYAHTLLELMYHPQVYKTGLCDHFDETDIARWKCVWKRRCAHAHGKGDVRSKEEAMEAWREHSLLTAAFQQQKQAESRGQSAGARRLSPRPAKQSATPWKDVKDGHTRAQSPQLSRSNPLSPRTQASSPGSPMRRSFAPPHTMRPDLFAQARANQRTSSPRHTSQSSRAIPKATVPLNAREGAAEKFEEDLGNIVYSKERVLGFNEKDGSQLYEGLTRSSGPAAIKVLSKAAIDDYIHTVADIEKLRSLGSSREMHFFTRYIDVVETPESIVIALETEDARDARGTNRPHRFGITLKDALSVKGAAHELFEPAETYRLMQQLFIALFSLHRLDIAHGDVGLHSIVLVKSAAPFVAGGSNSVTVRLGDIARPARSRSHDTAVQRRGSMPNLERREAVPSAEASNFQNRKLEIEKGKTKDVMAAACVMFALLRGQLPCNATNVDDSIARIESTANKLSLLDDAGFEPIATHFIVNTMLAAPEQRLSAEQVLRHPLFYSSLRRLQLLASVAVELRSAPTASSRVKSETMPHRSPSPIRSSAPVKAPSRSASSDHVKRQSVENSDGKFPNGKAALLHRDLEDLGPTILPLVVEGLRACRTWAALIDPRIRRVVEDTFSSAVDGESITSLLQFITNCLELCNLSRPVPIQLSFGAVPCEFHEALELPGHLQRCARKRIGSDASMCGPTTVADVLNAYFTRKFPSLLASVYHFVSKHWKDDREGPFAEILFGTFPPLLPSRPTAEYTSPMFSPDSGTASEEPIELDRLSPTAKLSVAPPQLNPLSPPAVALGPSRNEMLLAQLEQLETRLLTALMCPFGESQPHGLDDPVSTECCGKTCCRSCLGTYFHHAANNIPANPALQPGLSGPVVGRCECGRLIDAESRLRLANQPANQALGHALMALRQTQIKHLTASSGALQPPQQQQQQQHPAHVQSPSQSHSQSHMHSLQSLQSLQAQQQLLHLQPHSFQALTSAGPSASAQQLGGRMAAMPPMVTMPNPQQSAGGGGGDKGGAESSHGVPIAIQQHSSSLPPLVPARTGGPARLSFTLPPPPPPPPLNTAFGGGRRRTNSGGSNSAASGASSGPPSRNVTPPPMGPYTPYSMMVTPQTSAGSASGTMPSPMGMPSALPFSPHAHMMHPTMPYGAPMGPAASPYAHPAAYPPHP